MREWLDSVRRNTKYAIRILARSPSFTLTAVASLALGIAVNTTMFSVVSSLLLRPLGKADHLVRIGRSAPDERAFRSASYEDFAYLRQHATSFASITGHQIESVRAAAPNDDGAGERLSGEIVGDAYFATLGLSPPLGRGFSAAESDLHSSAAVVILSDRFWRRRFAASPSAVGSTITLEGQPFTVIGVAPADFSGTFPGVATDVWIPAATWWTMKSTGRIQAERSLGLIGRLKPGVSNGAAEAELLVLTRQIAEASTDTENAPRRFVVADARGAHPLLANALRVFLALLMAVVGVVLLIACANVTGLLLARARARRGEVAIRLSLGASRAQVVGQLLLESLVLSLIGGAVGLLLSILPLALLNGLSFIPGPTGAGIYLNVRLETRVLAFTTGVSIVTALLFGLVPALQATRVGLTSALQTARYSGGGSGARFRLGGALVVLQVSLSFVLLVGAALLFRSLGNIENVDLGFDPDNVVVASIDLEPLNYDRERSARFSAELLNRVRALRGVERAASASFVALSERRGHPMPLKVPGVASPPGQRALTVAAARVSDGYFATVHEPVISGRDFVVTDTIAARPVVIVNEAMARRHWAGGDALGRHIGLGEDVREHEIIGVVANARYSSFGGPIEPLVFLPAFEPGWLHVRSSAQPADVLRDIRNVVRDIDASALPYVKAESMRESLTSSMSLVPAKIARVIFSVSGVIAILLAAGGLYGLVNYTVEQRMKEIGIRVAMGANRVNVFGVVVGGAVRLTIVGLMIGVALAIAVMRVASSLLYGISPTDPVTFGGIGGVLAIVALAAGYSAARRGLNVDPMEILRHE